MNSESQIKIPLDAPKGYYRINHVVYNSKDEPVGLWIDNGVNVKIENCRIENGEESKDGMHRTA